MWSCRYRPWERELVAECEAYLAGHYAQYLREAKRLIPTWAWLNVLAHGSEDDVAALAAGEPCRRGSTDAPVWQQAVAFLAQEVLNQVAARGRPLADLQRSTLVPLEFELAERPALSPATFVASVLGVLAQHPTRQP